MNVKTRSLQRFRHGLNHLGLALLLMATGAVAAPDKAQMLRQQVEASIGDYPLLAFGTALKAEAVLQELYLEQNFLPVWLDAESKPTAQALSIIDEIGRAIYDGLQPSDYHYEQLLGLSKASKDELAEYDLLLSDAVANLSQHLLAGKVDPETLSTEWKAKRRHKDVSDLIAEIARSDDVAARINQLRPRQVRYSRLQRLLTRLIDNPEPEWTPVATYPAIKVKMRDARLGPIRQRLAYWGDWSIASGADDLPSTLDGLVYDEQLVSAVRRFQRRHGLEDDGVMGRLTLEALNVSPAERKQQIINNLERWRWLAEDLGEKHVLVNIAGFELKMVENNQTVMHKPVIVGRHYRRTPVFSDNIRYLVFNPTWTVPFKIAVQDKLPEMRRDPQFFARYGYTVYDRDKNQVDPATIDWNLVSQRNFSYQLVQSPGPQNALGQVKFMFPNPYDVYLHDTPSRELFGKNDRAFSSGCVRVSEPMELAAWLLKGNGMSQEQIDAVIAKGEPKTVFLKKPVPVHIEYWTAWVDSRGDLHFRNDIYERDPPLTAALAVPFYPPSATYPSLPAAL